MLSGGLVHNQAHETFFCLSIYRLHDTELTASLLLILPLINDENYGKYLKNSFNP
jgi:hypothetical protein